MSAWSIRAAAMVPAMAVPGSAFVILTGVVYYVIKVNINSIYVRVYEMQTLVPANSSSNSPFDNH